MAACPVRNPFDDQQLRGLSEPSAEKIRRAVEIWCRGEQLRLNGDYLDAVRVFREAGSLGFLSNEESSRRTSTFPHPRVVASGLSGELLLAVRDAIRRATRERADPDEGEEGGG